MDTNRTPETPQTPGQDDQTAAFETAPPSAATPQPVTQQPAAAQPVATPAPAPSTAAPSAKTAVWRRKPVWVGAAVVALLAGGAGVAYAVDELGDDDDDSSWSVSDERRADDLDRADRDGEYRSDDDRDSRGPDDRSGDGQAPPVTGDGSRDADQREDRTDADDVPLTDAEITSATDAALAEAGSGTVTDVDRSDDADHAFEVDVQLEDGDELEVELADDFTVVWTELDPADRG